MIADVIVVVVMDAVVIGVGSDVVVVVGLDQGLKEAIDWYGACGLAEVHLLLVSA